MSILNKRFSITINDLELAVFIEETAKAKNKSLSSNIQELLKIQMELDDDHYWSKVGEEACEKSEGKPGIPAQEVWKKCGLI